MKYRNIWFLVLIITFSSCFNLFEKEQRILGEVYINSQCKVEATLITTGATTKDVVQIMFLEGDSSKVIGTFESYDWVELIKMSNDSLLVKLSDSTSIPNYIDTQYIKLPKCK